MNNFKYIKCLLLLLVLSLFLAYNLVLASQNSSLPTIEVIQNNLQYQVYSSSGNYYTKDFNGTVQYYYNKETFTTLTNPCSNCIIGTRLHSSGGNYSGRLDLKMGKTSNFTTVTADADNWQLEQMRVDYTLLTTYHYGTWYINTTP